MKPNWKLSLESAGAECDEVGVVSFGNIEQEYAVALSGNVYADLSHLDLVGVTGDDVTTFLQGQFTNDVRKVTPEQAQFSSWCNPKGRILNAFLLFQREAGLYLQLPPGQAEGLIKRLRMFVMMSKVSLVDARGQWVRLGCSGPDMVEALEQGLETAPPTVDFGVVETGGLTVIRLPGLHPRFEIIGEAEPMEALREHLDVEGTGIGRGPWGLLDIASGVPVIDGPNAEAFVPQMVNLQLIGGLSFQKGCYTGQEVVARMQYLGKLKRRMYRAHVAAGKAPQPGGELWAPRADSAQGVGKVVNVAPSPNGGFELLAVVRIADYDHGDVRIGSADGAKLDFSELPYTFEPAS